MRFCLYAPQPYVDTTIILLAHECPPRLQFGVSLNSFLGRREAVPGTFFRSLQHRYTPREYYQTKPIPNFLLTRVA